MGHNSTASLDSLISDSKTFLPVSNLTNLDNNSVICDRGNQLDWSAMTHRRGPADLSNLGFSNVKLDGGTDSQLAKNCDSRAKVTDDSFQIQTTRPGEPPIVIKTSNGTIITISPIVGGPGGASVTIEKPPGKK